jgi:hypothetical protein
MLHERNLFVPPDERSESGEMCGTVSASMKGRHHSHGTIFALSTAVVQATFRRIFFWERKDACNNTISGRFNGGRLDEPRPGFRLAGDAYTRSRPLAFAASDQWFAGRRFGWHLRWCSFDYRLSPQSTPHFPGFRVPRSGMTTLKRSHLRHPRKVQRSSLMIPLMLQSCRPWVVDAWTS